MIAPLDVLLGTATYPGVEVDGVEGVFACDLGGDGWSAILECDEGMPRILAACRYGARRRDAEGRLVRIFQGADDTAAAPFALLRPIAAAVFAFNRIASNASKSV